MLELLRQPWHWSIAGILIGLIVPALLLLGNKNFGISSTLRHICAACFPAGIPFFKYNWRRETWNLFFVAGIAVGAFMAAHFLSDPSNVKIHPELASSLAAQGITDYSGMIPTQLFNWETLFSLKGLFFFVVGGFLIGFGTRWAGGCTSGHAINGLSNLEWPSLVATICFMVGGFICANWIVPVLLGI